MNWLDTLTLYFYDSYGAFPAVALVNLAVALLVMVFARAVAGLTQGVSALAELHERDNPAFGIAVAGLLFALATLLTGAMYGEAADTLWLEFAVMLGYGVYALAMMLLAGLVLEHVTLHQFSVRAEIQGRNVAVGIVHAGNLIATALIIRSAMQWQAAYGWADVLRVLGAFVVSQAILLAVARYRGLVFARRNGGADFAEALKGGNVALACRYTGHQIGVALGITAASTFADSALGWLAAVGAWAVAAVIATVAVSLMAIVLRHAVLFRVDVGDEVDRQRNVAVGAIEGLVYLSAGWLLVGLFA